MNNKTDGKLRIGFASFVDRPMLPFSEEHPLLVENPCASSTNASSKCEKVYTFHIVLPITEELDEWDKRLRDVAVSSNLDPPEAGLDAIIQAIKCDKIKWNKGVFRILIFSSDNAFHAAGDGAMAGLFTPNDAKCNMDDLVTYSQTEIMDFPSIGQEKS